MTLFDSGVFSQACVIRSASRPSVSCLPMLSIQTLPHGASGFVWLPVSSCFFQSQDFRWTLPPAGIDKSLGAMQPPSPSSLSLSLSLSSSSLLDQSYLVHCVLLGRVAAHAGFAPQTRAYPGAR